MKKTLLAVAIPTLALTGCFSTGSNATYVAPTPQVNPKPSTNTGTKPVTGDTNKPGTGTTNPGTGTTNPGTGTTNPGTGTTNPVTPNPRPTPTPGTGTTQPVVPPATEAKQAYDKAKAKVDDKAYQEAAKLQDVYEPLKQAADEEKAKLDKLNKAYELLSEAVAGVQKNIDLSEFNLSQLKEKLAKETDEAKKALISAEITKQEKAIEELKTQKAEREKAKEKAQDDRDAAIFAYEEAKEKADQAKKKLDASADVQKFNEMVVAANAKLLADKKAVDDAKSKAEVAELEAQKALTDAEYKHDVLLAGQYKDKHEEVKQYVDLLTELYELRKDPKSDEAKIAEKEKQIAEFVAKEGLQAYAKVLSDIKELNSKVRKATKQKQALDALYTVSGKLNGTTALTGSQKDVLGDRKLAKLLEDADNRISVSLTNAVHGILAGDTPEFFYQGYGTPTDYISSVQKEKTSVKAKYTGDAFVKVGTAKPVQGTSTFDVNFGGTQGGTISGTISYGDQKFELTGGTIAAGANTFSSNAVTGLTFQGGFYGKTAEELAGYFTEQGAAASAKREGTFGAAKQ